MFKRLIEWWKRISALDPAKDPKNMTDQQGMEELKALWDKAMVFNLDTSQSEYFRLELMKDTLDARGYVIWATTTGIRYTRKTK